MSYYNAAQLILRHPTSHGLNVDFSYTFSKSIDMGSDTERGTDFNQITGGANGGNLSNIINTWNPSLNRAVSDFDTRHLITADWVYLLPVGSGQEVSQWRRIAHQRFSWRMAMVWHQSLDQRSALQSHRSRLDDRLAYRGQWCGYRQGSDEEACRQWRTDSLRQCDAINSGTNNGSPIRLSYPGETGQRNNFRGDGIFGIDSGLSKSWRFGEYGALKFSWEVFNVTNSVRFNDNPLYFGTRSPEETSALTARCRICLGACSSACVTTSNRRPILRALRRMGPPGYSVVPCRLQFTLLFQSTNAPFGLSCHAHTCNS